MDTKMLERENTKLRVKKFREQLKKNREAWKNHLKNDAKRKRKSRAKEKEHLQDRTLTVQGKKEMMLKRLKETERKRNYRQRKRELQSSLTSDNISSPHGSFSCKQTFGKAMARIKKALPASPRKKVAIVKKLAYDTLSHKCSNLYKVNRQGTVALTNETKQKVIDFYIRDDISRQAPGKRDYKSIKNPTTREREKVQKRHMVITVKEAFALFAKENPEINIKRSKFYELRPGNVLLTSEMPHNVCICKRHANFNFVVEALSKTIENIPLTGKELLRNLCCDVNNEKCMIGLCTECKTDIFTLLPDDCNVAAKISWQQWADVNGRPIVVNIDGSVEDAVIDIQNKLSDFKIHCFVKSIQEHQFELKKKILQPAELLIQVDFAENYSCTAQDEIQSAHWSTNQVTIFTCVAWMKHTTKCYAIISDDLTHDKCCVWVFLKEIITDLKRDHSIEEVSIFSDGCASQFKNRYTLSNLCHMEEDFGVTGDWCFFATSHGKGAVDGVGGSVKRMVWERVKCRQARVSTAEQFYKCCIDLCKPGIRVLLMESSVINQFRNFLENRWQKTFAIPHVQSKHYFRALNKQSIVAGRTIMSELNVFEVWDQSNSDSESDFERKEVNQVKKIKYEDVYSDSDAECVQNCIDKSELKGGQFLLIQLVAESKQQRKHKYVGISQGSVESGNNIEVVYMKEVSGTMSVGKRQLFKIENSKSFLVSVNEIIGILPEPQLKEVGNRIFYEFQNKIEL